MLFRYSQESLGTTKQIRKSDYVLYIKIDIIGTMLIENVMIKSSILSSFTDVSSNHKVHICSIGLLGEDRPGTKGCPVNASRASCSKEYIGKFTNILINECRIILTRF